MMIQASRRFSLGCFRRESAEILTYGGLTKTNMVLLGGGRQQRRSFAKVSALSLQSKKRKGEKITVVTAYDYPSGLHAARAGIDILLIGDSASMVELGHETTQPVTIDEMIHHCKAVRRGVDAANMSNDDTANTPLLLGDMPFGSYEYEDTDIALRNAYRFIKEAGMDGVKLEVNIDRVAL